MTTKNIKTLQTWDTVYSADSAEWCPIAPFQHVFVCGTYQLAENPEQQEKAADLETASGELESEKSQIKLGRLYLFAVDYSGQLLNLQTIDMAAIFDTKWCCQRLEENIVLGVVNAKGELVIYSLKQQTIDGDASRNVCQLVLQTKTKLHLDDEKKVSALSLDWLTSGDILSEARLTVSDSCGFIHIFTLSNLHLKLLTCVKAHDFEAWITAFDYWKTSVFYSGGDDCKLLVFDSKVDSTRPVLTNKVHEMGVTSIHCNEGKENVLITGSYDEKLRIWDTRFMKKPVKSVPLIGGIWRLKWNPHDYEHILAACMHGGFCLVHAAEDLPQPQIIGVYKEHSSLAYGSDWCYLSDNEIRPMLQACNHEHLFHSMSLIVTCSFYDHKLCLSVVDKCCEVCEEENETC